jgi:hypothetical protein
MARAALLACALLALLARAGAAGSAWEVRARTGETHAAAQLWAHQAHRTRR